MSLIWHGALSIAEAVHSVFLHFHGIGRISFGMAAQALLPVVRRLYIDEWASCAACLLII